jgi:hypothetical protein
MPCGQKHHGHRREGHLRRHLTESKPSQKRIRKTRKVTPGKKREEEKNQSEVNGLEMSGQRCYTFRGERVANPGFWIRVASPFSRRRDLDSEKRTPEGGNKLFVATC